MENVSRIKYLEELNQLWLIGSDNLRIWLKGHGRPNTESVAKQILDYVKGVNSSSQGDIILGACYTNLLRYYFRTYGSNLMVFPIQEEITKYFFKNNKEYLISNKENPTIICPTSGLHFSQQTSILFFKENPFENIEKYEDVSFFQSKDNKSILRKGRKKLVKRAFNAGMGSLNFYLKNEL